tara:strand:+ start:4886 stop:5227 length:342 start_codon:yes stop_codon:yes gene_type:complete
MSTQNEAHGNKHYSDHLANALQDAIECILEHGQYPANGRVQFDLYNFLFEHRNGHRDSSFALEMYVASMSSDIQSFEERIEQEREAVCALLVKELTGSEMVQDLADVMAEDDE